MDFSVLFTTGGLVSLFTLSLLEIVLGIDNLIFISIIADKLPKEKQAQARNIGILMALVVRIALLFAITWIIGLTADIFNFNDILTSIGLDLGLSEETIHKMGISGKDLILLIGGLFLIAKSTSEIHEKLEVEEEAHGPSGKAKGIMGAVIQIVMIDIVFSFDSILTAVGLVKEVIIMIVAVVISLTIMLIFAKKVSDFINNHPSLKMLALSFLIMIGFLLTVEAFEVAVPKGYIYFAMAFAFIVELLNMRLRKNIQSKRKKRMAASMPEKKS